MMCRRLLLGLVVTAMLASHASSQPERREKGGTRGYPPKIYANSIEVYKTIDDVKLNIWIFQSFPFSTNPFP